MTNSCCASRVPEHRLFYEPRPLYRDVSSALSVFFELLSGFAAFRSLGPCVTFFGSARFTATHPYYIQTFETAARLAESGVAIMTGGGPGLMEAANRGAKSVGGRSLGCNVILPDEQHPNDHLDACVTFKHFYVRKLMLVKYSFGFVVMPGGFGTLDELFETLTLIQTGKVSDFPIILMGRDYWAPLEGFIRERLALEGAIAAEHLRLVRFTDSIAEAVTCILSCASRKFGLALRAETPSCPLCEEAPSRDLTPGTGIGGPL